MLIVGKLRAREKATLGNFLFFYIAQTVRSVLYVYSQPDAEVGLDHIDTEEMGDAAYSRFNFLLGKGNISMCLITCFLLVSLLSLQDLSTPSQ